MIDLPPTEAGPQLPDWLTRQAWLQPDGLALLCDQQAWSFAALDRRADAVAAGLAELGVKPTEPVALLGRNGADYVALVHGITRHRAILVPLNVRLTEAEIAFQLQDVRARWLIHEAELADLAQRLRARLPGLDVVEAETLAVSGPGPTTPSLDRPGGLPEPGCGPDSNQRTPSQSDAEPPADRRQRPGPTAGVGATRRSSRAPARYVNLAAVHSVIYTSGTSGRPKGALLTYGNFWWSAIGSVLNLGLQADDRWLAVLPLFHVGGLSILLRSVIYGMPVVVQRGFDPAEVNRAIDQQGVSIVSLVSPMLQRLLEQRGERPFPASLRCVLLGGGPAPAPLLEACRWRGVPVVQTYGLTETASQVATLSPRDALRKLGSSGKPLLPTELRVLDDGGEAAPGAVGEIVVRGPTVSAGYINQDAAGFRALRGGWLRTGDLGYLDDEGYLYVLDRRDDLIVSGGENVYPAEIEAVLLRHPAVAAAAVTGRADPTWGQVPVAWLELQPGATITPEALETFCRASLASYKVPRQYREVESLPRNAAGKLLRRELRQAGEA